MLENPSQTPIPWTHAELDQLITKAFEEDTTGGDITSEAIFRPRQRVTARAIAKAPLVVCGLPVAARVFSWLDPNTRWTAHCEEGQHVTPQTVLFTVEGAVRSVLSAERIALNLLQHLSGIATHARQFADAVAGTHTRVVDTRKTLPGMRVFQRYAVRVGGCFNHRYNLGSGVLIKENHIRAAGSIARAVQATRQYAPHLLKIEVEVTNLDELLQALSVQADVILLDNMSNEMMREAVQLTDKRAILEASGNVSLERVRSIAETGVDFVSVGALTHSVRAADISLLVHLEDLSSDPSQAESSASLPTQLNASTSSPPTQPTASFTSNSSKQADASASSFASDASAPSSSLPALPYPNLDQALAKQEAPVGPYLPAVRTFYLEVASDLAKILGIPPSPSKQAASSDTIEAATSASQNAASSDTIEAATSTSQNAASSDTTEAATSTSQNAASSDTTEAATKAQTDPPPQTSLPSRFQETLLPKLRESLFLSRGIRIPSCLVEENPQIRSGHFACWIEGTHAGSGEIPVDRLLVGATPQELRIFQIEGRKTLHPLSMRDASFVSETHKTRLKEAYIPLWNAEELLILHLTAILERHAERFLGTQALRTALDIIAHHEPTLVAQTLDRYPLSTLRRILLLLAEDRLSLCNLHRILESLLEVPPDIQDIEPIADATRRSMRRYLCQPFAVQETQLLAYNLAPHLELLLQHLFLGRPLPEGISAPTSMAPIQALYNTLQRRFRALPSSATLPLLLVRDHALRRPLQRVLQRAFPYCGVLSWQEIDPDYDVMIIETLDHDVLEFSSHKDTA